MIKVKFHWTCDTCESSIDSHWSNINPIHDDLNQEYINEEERWGFYVDGRGHVYCGSCFKRRQFEGDSPKSNKHNLWFDSGSEFIGELPRECINACSRSGDTTQAVRYWQAVLRFEVPQEKAREWLYEFGAWSFDDLQAMSDTEVNQKVLWLACCDLSEFGEWLGLIH